MQVGQWYSGWYVACYVGGYSSCYGYWSRRTVTCKRNWGLDLSVLGESFGHTPLVVPVRGHLDSIKRLLRGDVYIGRGSRQRSLPKSRYCNTFKVSQVGRSIAISSFREALRADPGPPQLALDFIGNEASLPLSGYGRLPWRRFD